VLRAKPKTEYPLACLRGLYTTLHIVSACERLLCGPPKVSLVCGMAVCGAVWAAQGALVAVLVPALVDCLCKFVCLLLAMLMCMPLLHSAIRADNCSRLVTFVPFG
jgi:hypothetical protein